MKTINATLLAHKKLPSTTLTNLLLIGPLPDATYRGFTSLSGTLIYNDGNGAVTYVARTGMELSATSETNDLGVDNAESSSLFPIPTYEAEGITQAQIDAGFLDNVPFVVYRVNYNDLTTGRHEIVMSGTVGEVTAKYGQTSIFELRSLSQQLKQSIGDLDSLTCRARFGSMPIGTGGGVVEERFPCNFDTSTTWVAGTVTSVGSEADIELTDTALGTAYPTAAYFAPGVVKMVTGANAGITREIDSYAATGDIVFQFAYPFNIAIGDTYTVRRDCTKNPTGHNSCTTFWTTTWVLHFRGEPAIQVGSSATLSVPGAAISASGSSAGTGEAL